MTERFGENGGDAERSGQDVGKPSVVRAVGLRPDKPGVPDFSGGDYPDLLGALHLAVHRRMRCASQARDLSQAQLTIRIAEEQRKDFTLLLRAQNGQERRRRASIHNLKNTLQIVEFTT